LIRRVVPAGILGELGYLVDAKLGGHALRDLVADLDRRAFALDCGDEDIREIARLLDRYDDLRFRRRRDRVRSAARRPGPDAPERSPGASRLSGRGLPLEADRARRGGSGALNPQSALAGLNSLPRSSGPRGQRAGSGVDGRVPRGAGS
jgi:hypothetical protein